MCQDEASTEGEESLSNPRVREGCEDVHDAAWAGVVMITENAYDDRNSGEYARRSGGRGLCRRKGDECHEGDVSVCQCEVSCGVACHNLCAEEECWGAAGEGNCKLGPGACGNREVQCRDGWPSVAVFRCGEKGFGLCAKEDIGFGRVVIEYVGEVIGVVESERRVVALVQRSGVGGGSSSSSCSSSICNNGGSRVDMLYSLQLTSDAFVDARLRGNMSRFINHSCDPNCAMVKVRCVCMMAGGSNDMMSRHFVPRASQDGDVYVQVKVRYLTRVAVVALRLVKSEEELTFDYRLSCGGSFVCRCGAASCRGFAGEVSHEVCVCLL